MNEEPKMPPSDTHQLAKQLSAKRTALFWLAFSVVGLLYGWPFAPSMWGVSVGFLRYRGTWAVFTLTMLLTAIATDGLLWLARNPGKTRADYYQRKYWWLHALDFEYQIRFGKRKSKEDQA
ncbi:hypothetical protein [Ralstonia syzygii]|uniref:hypothetical protein n=1 Tax=Ralstonia syzygii TaxID=28097 RepID=UPI0018D07076|nr:hypothetical protein [Ralstonia syzygii]